nr:hypothetical protein CFP56_60446 [Quercus suber]
MASRRSAFHGGSPDSSPRPRFGLLDLQISHRETASEEKGTLKTNTSKSNFIQQNGQRFWLNPNSSTVMPFLVAEKTRKKKNY